MNVGECVDLLPNEISKRSVEVLLMHMLLLSSYQFLDDAYKNHKQYLENMTQQLQEKRKAIEEVSGYISTG